MLGRTAWDRRPKACGTYVTMPDDSSRLSTRCQDWFEKKYGYPSNGTTKHGTDCCSGGRLYGAPMGIVNNTWLSLWGNQKLYCDDSSKEKGYSDAGHWEFFVK